MILAPSGAPLTREYRMPEADARTLRDYKKILAKYGYGEELWCQTCETEGDHAGCRAYVTDSRIAIECRHRRLFFQGSTR